jgi:chromosomal replication initiation ATPase DnaA
MLGNEISPYVFPGIGNMEGHLAFAAFTRAVCERLDVSFDEVRSPCRRQELVSVRYAMFHCLVRREKKTTIKVGSFFNRDHSSVVHGVKTWTNLLQVKDAKAWRIQEVVNMVYHNQTIFNHGQSKDF